MAYIASSEVFWVALSRLYVARDDKITAVSRVPLRMSGADPVRRDWRTLVEVTAPVLRPKPPRLLSDPVLVILPPVLAGSLTVAFAPVEAGIAVGGALFFAASYVAPVLRRRALAAARRRPEVLTLSAAAERAAFQRAVDLADRIAETWPSLAALIDVPEASTMLAEALWEIAGVLTRRQELNAVLADLNHPDFAAVSATDRTRRELRSQQQATRVALAQLDAELSRREASLRRAEEAGRAFIRDQEMRRAIQAAEDSLRSAPPAGLSELAPDPAADLAEQTRSVLAAYRELTTDLHLNPPLR
jgi:hypothetical protein